MQKIKLLIIIGLAVLGAFLIYNHFDNKNKNLPEANQFSNEYNLVENDNIYKYKTIDQIIDILSNKTGIVFFCTKDSTWCQYYAYYLNNILKKYNVSEINYLDIKKDRELDTTKYQKIVDLLSNYLYTDDLNNKKIFMPEVIFVKNGTIIAHNNDTSLIASDEVPEEYWNSEKINNFENILKEYVIMLNEEES